MSIKLRLALLLGLLLLVFLFSLVALRALERRQIAETLASARRDDTQLVETWIDLHSSSLRRFVADTVDWPELAAFATDPAANADWPGRHLDPLLSIYGADALWLAKPDGRLLHHTRRAHLPKHPLPLPEEHLPDLAAPSADPRVYYHASEIGLWEVRATRLANTEASWFFVARLWDQTYLERLGDLTDSKASLAAPSATAVAFSPPAGIASERPGPPIMIHRQLLGWDGRPVRILRLLKAAPDISFRVESDRLQTRVFLLFGLCLIASLAVSLHQWVLRPLGWITDSLSRHDTAPIRPLLRARNELTKVARLIVTSFEHREQLRREIAERRHAEAELQKTLEERARLGRDLHDGLIQSLYAAGMGLAAARKRVQDDPAAAERHIAQVAAVLNDSIREVRDFITGLEPESGDQGAFTPTVARLFATMNAQGSARVELDLDEEVAARFPNRLRTELLLVLREAFSNALRHGRARLVRVGLDAAPGRPDIARLVVADDGEGFDPATARRGRGLDNLFARAAAHGARAHIESHPGQGCQLAFEFPLAALEEEDEEPDTARHPATAPTQPTEPRDD